MLAIRMSLVVFQEGSSRKGLPGGIVRRFEGDELNLIGIPGIVMEGSLDGIHVVRADGHQRPLSTEVAMELILQIDEGRVPLWGEGDIPQDGADDKGPDGGGGVLLDRHGDHLVGRRLLVSGGVHLAEENFQRPAQSLDAQQIVAIGGDVNLVNHLFAQGIDLILGQFDRGRFHCFFAFGGDLVELDAEFEAQLIKGLVGIGPADVREEIVAIYRQSGHGGL